MYTTFVSGQAQQIFLAFGLSGLAPPSGISVCEAVRCHQPVCIMPREVCRWLAVGGVRTVDGRPAPTKRHGMTKADVDFRAWDAWLVDQLHQCTQHCQACVQNPRENPSIRCCAAGVTGRADCALVGYTTCVAAAAPQ